RRHSDNNSFNCHFLYKCHNLSVRRSRMTSSLHERMTGPAKCGHKKMTTGVNCINNMNRGYGYEFKDQNCGTASERIDIYRNLCGTGNPLPPASHHHVPAWKESDSGGRRGG